MKKPVTLTLQVFFMKKNFSVMFQVEIVSLILVRSSKYFHLLRHQTSDLQRY
jgi:hypothetical protein